MFEERQPEPSLTIDFVKKEDFKSAHKCTECPQRGGVTLNFSVQTWSESDRAVSEPDSH